MSNPEITLWTGQTIPRLGFGCWAIGGPFWADAIPVGWGVVDDNESKAAIAVAIEAGVKFFDTADVYGAGHSEKKSWAKHSRATMTSSSPQSLATNSTKRTSK